MTLAQKLNKYGASFQTSESGVTLDLCPKDDLLAEDGTVTDPDLNTFLNLLDQLKVFVDRNPRDRRSGLVCFVKHDSESAWFDESGFHHWR